VHEALIVVRLAHFAAIMAVFGGSAFRCYGFAGSAMPAEPGALALFDRWLARLVLAGALVALASGLIMVPCVTAVMAGSADAALDPSTLGAVLVGTAFGRVWCWHLLVALLLVLAAGTPARWRSGAVLGIALPVLASLGLVGHAAGQGGLAGFGHEVNQSLHLLAAGLWLGGLLPLGWLLRRARHAESEGFAALVREAVPAFSQMGYAAVGVIAITGAINTLILVGSLGGLFGTAYGRLLSLKILLYLTMVAIALVNHFRIAPGLLGESRPVASAAALYRSVLVEQALGLAILVAVSVLGTWPPAAGGS
jgi:copper resistance protein D